MWPQNLSGRSLGGWTCRFKLEKLAIVPSNGDFNLDNEISPLEDKMKA